MTAIGMETNIVLNFCVRADAAITATKTTMATMMTNLSKRLTL